jgi:hypothetical protein
VLSVYHSHDNRTVTIRSKDAVSPHFTVGLQSVNGRNDLKDDLELKILWHWGGNHVLKFRIQSSSGVHPVGYICWGIKLTTHLHLTLIHRDPCLPYASVAWWVARGTATNTVIKDSSLNQLLSDSSQWFFGQFEMTWPAFYKGKKM